MAIQPYLFFDGRTEEALEYYRHIWEPLHMRGKPQ